MNLRINQIINEYVDPYIHKTWREMDVIHSIGYKKGKITLKLKLGYPLQSTDPAIDLLKKRLMGCEDVNSIDLNISFQVSTHAVRPRVNATSKSKKISSQLLLVKEA